MIEVHLYGELRRYAGKTDPREEAVLRIPYREGLTVADLLRELGIDPEREVSNIFIIDLRLAIVTSFVYELISKFSRR
jgi:hypothetical protein